MGNGEVGERRGSIRAGAARDLEVPVTELVRSGVQRILQLAITWLEEIQTAEGS